MKDIIIPLSKLTSDEIKDIALSKGWQEKIITYGYDKVQGRIKTEENNPQTYEEFIEKFYTDFSVSEIVNVKIGSLDKEIEAQKELSRKTIEDEIKDRFDLSIVDVKK